MLPKGIIDVLSVLSETSSSLSTQMQANQHLCFSADECTLGQICVGEVRIKEQSSKEKTQNSDFIAECYELWDFHASRLYYSSNPHDQSK